MKKTCSLVLFSFLVSLSTIFAMEVETDASPPPKLSRSHSAGSIRSDGTAPLSRQSSRINIFLDPNQDMNVVDNSKSSEEQTPIKSWPSRLDLSDLRDDITAIVPDDKRAMPQILLAVVTEVTSPRKNRLSLERIMEEDDEDASRESSIAQMFSSYPTRGRAEVTLGSLLFKEKYTGVLGLVLDKLYNLEWQEAGINKLIYINDLAKALNEAESAKDQKGILDDKLAHLYNSQNDDDGESDYEDIARRYDREDKRSSDDD